MVADRPLDAVDADPYLPADDPPGVDPRAVGADLDLPAGDPHVDLDPRVGRARPADDPRAGRDPHVDLDLRVGHHGARRGLRAEAQRPVPVPEHR